MFVRPSQSDAISVVSSIKQRVEVSVGKILGFELSKYGDVFSRFKTVKRGSR
jgi:hypothetical protein